LAAAREARGVSHSDAAASTNIKVQHIEAIERDDFSQFAAPAYAKGFIRIYADYLGLDSAPLVKQYMDAHETPASPLPPMLKPEVEPDEAALPSPSAEGEEERPSDPNPGKSNRSLVRIVAPVIGIVLLVILVTKLFGGKGDEEKNSQTGGNSSEAGRPLLIGEPPAPYLDPDAAP